MTKTKFDTWYTPTKVCDFEVCYDSELGSIFSEYLETERLTKTTLERDPLRKKITMDQVLKWPTKN